MGLITELIGQEFQAKRQERQLQIEALSHVMQSSMTPEKKSEYAKEALKKIGLKGQSHEMFHGLLTRLGHADSKGKQESDKPMFETPEQPEERALGFQKREADQKESEELDLQKKKDAEALELDRQKFEETQRQKKAVYDATIAFYRGQLKQVPDLPLTFEQQNERIMGIARAMEEAGRVYRGLPASEPKQPATPAAELKEHTIRREDGSEVAAVQTGPQQYAVRDAQGKLKPIPFDPFKDKVDPKDPAPPKESQGVRDAAAFYETQGMTPEAARAKALADAEEKAASERKEADLRARKSQQDLTTASESAAEAKRLQQHYKPGGQSIANPKKDGAIEAGAWSWLQTNVTPYYRLPAGYKGTSPQQLMIARANELLADLGLTGQDLAAIRGRAKSELSSLSSASQFAARIQQSEDLLMRNVATAKNLSDQFKRGDIRMYNRVLEAFKTGKGDPEALNLAAQLHIVAREWGKIMAGSTGAAGVPISEGKAADDFVAAKMSAYQLDDLIEKVIKPDAANRVAANQSVIDDLTVKLRNVAKLNAPTSEPTDRLGKQAGGGQQGGDMITVQLPDGTKGPIHSSQKDNFLRDHPGSKVVVAK